MLDLQDKQFIQQEIQKAQQKNQQMIGSVQNRGIPVTNNSGLKTHVKNVIGIEGIKYWTVTALKTDKSTTLNGAVNIADFAIQNDLVTGIISLTSLNDPSGAIIYFTLPIKAKLYTNNRVIGTGYISNAGTGGLGYMYIEANDDTYAAVQINGGGAWGAANNELNMTFVYNI